MKYHDRIPANVWLGSQLSVSRYFGGCTIQGHSYVVDPRDNSLVRETVLKAELKAEKRRKNAEKAAKRAEEANLQGELL